MSGPPRRAVLRLAGVFTQLISASCLLLGTIAFVLIYQNKTGGSGYVIGWALAAMVALVFGGLMARGSLIAVIGAAVFDAAFGIVLFSLDDATLHGLLRVLPAGDVEMIGAALNGAAGAMLAIAVLCLVAIPQALRYARWLVRDRDLAGPGSTQPGTTGSFAASGAGSLGPRTGTSPSPSLEPQLPGSTARGWAPPTAKISVWHLPVAAPGEARSRRRMYIALAGVAIGFGAGIGVLVSTTTSDGTRSAAAATSGSGSTAPATVAPDATTPAIGSELEPAEGPVGEGGAAEDLQPVQALVDAQRVAIGEGDVRALAAMLSPEAFGFGIDADEVAEGRKAITAHLKRALGEVPPEGLTVEPKFQAIGEHKNHAWIAMELEVAAPGEPPRRLAITQLAAVIENKWTVVAWHWAVPVPDATAEKLAILNTLPRPTPITRSVDAPEDLEAAVRAAFASRAAFTAARSERPDGFNFGSAPGERIVGGPAVKRVFGRLKAQLRVRDGVHVVGGGAWDPAQQDTPWIGFAALNVDFTAKTRAATDLTQAFRVLAVVIKEGADWKIVQTQWSHGGPIR